MTSSRTLKITVLLATVLLLFVVGTPNANAKPTRAELKQAKALFDRAEAAVAKREYVRSAELYLEAYAIFPSTDFLFNAASMYRQADKNELARKYYEQYLFLDPQGKGAPEAKVLLATYKAERKETLEREQERKRVVAVKKSDVELLSKPSTSSNSLRLPALLGMSAGVLLVGVGGFYVVKTKIISNDVSNSPRFDPALEKKGRTAERNSYVFGGIGAAVAVGSAVLYLLGSNKKSKESTLTLVPAIHNESIGALLYGQF